MKGKFEFKEGYSYHMPVHFRGMPAGEVMNPLYGDVFVLSADLTTEMDALAQFVPKDFEILEPVVNVQYNDCRGVDWMSHGEYRLLQFGVPVRYLGNDEGLTGLYQLVLLGRQSRAHDHRTRRHRAAQDVRGYLHRAALGRPLVRAGKLRRDHLSEARLLG